MMNKVSEVSETTKVFKVAGALCRIDLKDLNDF